MLKEKDQGRDRSFSVATRVVIVTLLAAAGTAAVAFRGVSPARAEGIRAASPAATEIEGRRFDLSYMWPDAVGIWAMRPAAISRIPGMKPYLDKLDAEFAKAGLNASVKVETIEQAVVEFRVEARDQSKKKPGVLITGDWLIRSVEDFDWKAVITTLVKKLGPKPGQLVEVRLDNRVYYRAAGSGFGVCGLFYFPDARTVICSFHEDRLRERIRRGVGDRLEFLRGDDWRQVERGLVAVAIDNRKGRWKLDASKENPEDLLIAPLIQNATRWVGGVDFSELLKINAIATCRSVAESEIVSVLMQKHVKEAKAALAGGVRASLPEKDREAELLLRTVKDLLQSCRVHREGVVVDLSSERKIEVDALAAFFLELVP